MKNLQNLLKETIEKRVHGVDRSQDTLDWLSGHIVALEKIRDEKINAENIEAEKEKANTMRIQAEMRTNQPDEWLRGYLVALEKFNELV